jgi:hypothetical protein
MNSSSPIRMGGLVAAILSAVTLVGARHAQPPASTADAWRGFEGTWSATGVRHRLPTEEGREAAIVQLSGAVVLAVDGGLSRGFHGQAIGFDDGRDLRAGRAVWTDDRGDQIFSALTGGPLLAGERFSGTITGGTGGYTGLTGEFSFTWQYVVRSDDGTIQGRAVGLTGKARRAPTAPARSEAVGEREWPR